MGKFSFECCGHFSNVIDTSVVSDSKLEPRNHVGLFLAHISLRQPASYRHAKLLITTEHFFIFVICADFRKGRPNTWQDVLVAGLPPLGSLSNRTRTSSASKISSDASVPVR